MTKEALLAFIKNYLTNSIGRPKPNSIDYKDWPEYIHLVNLFPWTNYWPERIYCLENDIKENPKCPLCDKPVNFTRNEYSKHCSRDCSSKASRVYRAQGIKASVRAKYGVENISQLDTVKAIKRDIINSRTSEDKKRTLEKRRKTNFHRYGIEEVLSKINRKTKPSTKEIEELRNRTITRALNDPQNIEDIKKIKVALREDNRNEYIDISKKLGIGHGRFAYLQKTYNIPDPNLHIRYKHDVHLPEYKPILEELYKTNPIEKIAKKFGATAQAIRSAFSLHGIKARYDWFQSSKEIEIIEHIQSLTDTEIISNSRNVIPPYEIDIVIPEFKLAIEHNGDRWHTNDHGNQDNKHRIKHSLCKESNIRLLQIRGLDWKNKEAIWKSIIQNALGQTKRIYARKCVIKEVLLEEANQFLDANHLQGKTRSKTRLGLYYNNELVMLQTFGVSRFKKGRTELIRMCAKLGTTVTGGATKLFKHYIKTYNPEVIDTYADLEYATGNVYKTMGFELVKLTDPGYCYYDGKQYHNRMNFQKKKFNIPENITEKEYFLGLGYRIYWDCGQACFTWTAPQL